VDRRARETGGVSGSGGLVADVTLRLGELDLDVSIRARPGETLALLGPNGAGKTTLLRCLAGLQPIGAGRIELGGRVLDAPVTTSASRPGTGAFVPPQQRGVGVVFQEHLLFPSMSALENVAFGLRARGVGRAAARSKAGALLEAVGLAGRERDRPSALSGGQRQRVALARALAIEPDLLLLDEPLAALDVSTRSEVRRELRRHLDALSGGVRVVVTHDPVDAFALASRVVVLEGGRVTHDGPLAEIAARPRTRYVADLIGVNLYAASAAALPESGGVMLSVEVDGTAGAASLVAAGASLVTGGDAAPAGGAAAEGGPVFAVVHPRAVALHRDRPSGSPRNVWRAPVCDVDLEADRARVRLGAPLPITAEITAASAAELSLRPGEEVWASVKATEIEVYGQ
jgi:molybdate transport system ATP-binding protein